MKPGTSKKNRPYRVFGLTGNIACGKSEVSRILRSLGVSVVDADHVSREVCKPGSPTLEKIKRELGDDLLSQNGELNRQRLRAKIFADSELRKRFESIMHPAIRDMSFKKFEELHKTGVDLFVYEASLIVEAGRKDDFDGLLLVTCPQEQQLRYLRARDSTITDELALQMTQSQLPQSEKVKMADWIIENSGSLQDLEEKVLDWLKKVRNGN